MNSSITNSITVSKEDDAKGEISLELKKSPFNNQENKLLLKTRAEIQDQKPPLKIPGMELENSIYKDTVKAVKPNN